MLGEIENPFEEERRELDQNLLDVFRLARKELRKMFDETGDERLYTIVIAIVEDAIAAAARTVQGGPDLAAEVEALIQSHTRQKRFRAD